MFQADLFANQLSHLRAEGQGRRAERARGAAVEPPLDLPGVLQRLAEISERPRHTFMVLNLIAGAADAKGSAGPLVVTETGAVPIREWLCEALVPMAGRDPRRLARAASVRTELEAKGALPDRPEDAERVVEQEVRARVRRTGLTHVSRAVSDLVKAGLIRRHYQGYLVDHHNRGAQRHAVYTLLPQTRAALAGASD